MLLLLDHYFSCCRYIDSLCSQDILIPCVIQSFFILLILSFLIGKLVSKIFRNTCRNELNLLLVSSVETDSQVFLLIQAKLQACFIVYFSGSLLKTYYISCCNNIINCNKFGMMIKSAIYYRGCRR